MKQTKKIVVLLMALCLMLSCIFALASCGDDPCSHSETEWVVVKEATATEDGQKNEVCKYCDEILSTDKIPATGTVTPPEIVPVPVGLTLNGTVFSWNKVEGATSYVVKVDNDTYTVTSTTFDLATITLTPNTSYSVSVQAVKADGSSEFCSAVKANYLTKSFALSYSENTVSWDYVIGASDYEVKVNGSDAVPVTGTNSAKIVLTQSGDNIVEVRYTNGEGSDWVQLTVQAFAVTYNPHSLTGGETVEYLATGDHMTLPTGDYSNIGYEFTGWFTATENGEKYENNSVFTATEDLMVHGGWAARKYILNLGVEGLGITNITDGTTAEVTYNSEFTLPVPVPADENNVFAGWYTTQFSSGVKVADELGKSIDVAKFTETTTIYPVFITNVLDYELKSDDTYAVTAGPNFDKISNVTIPVTYKGKPVTSILENAFEGHKLLVTISIPNTIELIGSGAFTGNSSLEAINIYEVEGTHEVFYASYDGALIRNDMGTVTLEVFPRAKTGTFKTPEGVTTIRNKVFQFSNIDKVIISKDVVAIYERAFYSCKRLTTIEFEGGRDADVVLMCGTNDQADSIFYSTPNITSIHFPAMLAEFNYTYVLDQLTKLTNISVEAGGTVYSAVDGILTNGDEDTMLYAPLSVTGDFEIPSGIIAIGNNAFRNRTGLTSVKVPLHVESIGANAFDGCKSVKNVTIAGNRFIDLTIGNQAFANCTALTSVIIGGNDSDTDIDEGAITIGTKAFAPASGSASLVTVTFGKGVNVASIGNEAFKNQTKLTTLNFADNVNVVAIGSSAFEATSIKSLAIPASVTSIGSSAFNRCEEIRTVTFKEGSNGNVAFGASAFANCTRITSVYLPSTVTTFDGTVFNGCSTLAKIEVDPANPVLVSDTNGVLYDKNYTKLIYYPRGLDVDKATLDALPWSTITTIGNAAFSGHETLDSFEIKKGITTIGEAAFSNCPSLTTLTYESGAAAGTTLVIEKNAFANCQKLSSASIPDYTTEIGEAAFLYSSFASFAMPSSVTTIGMDAFKWNSKLTAIDIPAKVTSIGAGAFSNCTSLATVNVDGSTGASLFEIKSSGTKGTFLSCTKLKTIDLKNRATNIGAQMFKNSGLESITLGSNISDIGAYAFQNTKLSSINIPANVTNIGIGAFATESGKTSYLSSVTFEEGDKALTLLSKVFENATKIQSITFPARTQAIGQTVTLTTYNVKVSGVPDVFSGCTGLKNINVTPGQNNKYVSINGVLYQADNNVPVTLLYCPSLNEGVAVNNVATLTVPKTVTLVENRALYNLKNIKTITFEEYANGEAKKPLRLGNGELGHAVTSDYAVIGGAENAVTTINLPSHISFFASYSVTKTANIVELNIPEEANDISIGYYAFNGAKIVKYNFPGVKEVGRMAFASAFASASFTANELNTLPFEIIFGDKSTLTVIAEHCFNGSKIEKFTVPASVVETTNSFYNSTRLKTVDFAPGSKLKKIGAQTFGLCTSLVSVDFSNATEFETFEGANIFQNCTSMTSFTFPETTKFVSNNFFTGANKIEEVTLNKTFTPEMLYDINVSNQQTSVLGSFSTGSTVPAFKKVNVDPENPYFTVVDGVLYSKDMSTIYCYPPARSTTGYTIPDTVTTIAHYAFQHYQGSTLKLPDDLVYIGDFAFRYSNLSAVSIGVDVEQLGMYSFANCAKLLTVSFNISNTKLTGIGSYAFMGDNVLTAVNNIPDSVSVIGTCAFQSCSSLTKITLPAPLTKIEANTFQGCSKLASVTMQQSVTSIGDRAFYNAGITEITIPAAVTSIGQEAFTGTTSALTKVTFLGNSKLAVIGARAFLGCSKLETINLPETVTEFEIYVDTFGTTNSAANTFYGCTSLKSISIPNIIEIPEGTFEGCTALETVELGDALTTIGAKAFYNNTSLKSITIPAGVTSIGSSAFENCSAMKTLEFENGSAIQRLGTSENANDNIFKNTTSLESVTLPTSITLIGGHVFENSGISSTNLGSLSNLETVGDYAFANCDNIEKLIVVTSVTHLGDYAFFDCDNISDLSLTFGVEYFGELAFGSCDKITDGYIPSTVYTLNGNPYAGCPGVTSLRIDEDNTELTVDEHGSVYNTDKTVLHYYSTSIPAGVAALPGTVETIAPGAFAGSQITGFTFLAKYGEIAPFTFYNCKNLATISIINGITTIGDYAFYGCEQLNNVTIPASATVTSTVWSDKTKGNVMPTTIGNYAFANCSALSDVTFANSTNIYVIGTHLFENCRAMTEVKLPANFSITDDDALASKLATKFYYVNPNNGAVNRYEPMKHIIPSYMFAGTGIVDAVIPANVYYLETEGVFMNCKALETVTFEAPAADPSKNATVNANAGNLSYAYIGNYMFYNCDSLVTIEIPNSNAANPLSNSIGYSFAECDNLETVILYYKPANSATPTNEGMFMNCKKLKTLTLYNVSKITNAGNDGSEDAGGSEDGGAEEEAPGGGTIGGSTIGGSTIGGSTIGGSTIGGIGGIGGNSVIDNGNASTLRLAGPANNASTFGLSLSTSTLGSATAGDVVEAEDATEESSEDTVTTTTGFGTANGSTIGSATGNLGSSDVEEEAEEAPGGSTIGGSTIGGSTIGGSTIGGSTIGGSTEDSEDAGGSSDGTTPDDATYEEGYLDYIGNNYFKGCESLQEITVMNDAYIGDSAFEGCTSLKEVIFYDPNATNGTPGGENNGGSEDGGAEEEAPGGSTIGGSTIGGSTIGGSTIGGKNSGSLVGNESIMSSNAQSGASTLGLGTATGGSAIGGISTGGAPGAGTIVGDVEDAEDAEDAEDGSGSTIGGSTIGGSTIGGSTIGGSTIGGSTIGGSTTGGSSETSSLAYLGNNAFKGCTALTEITLPGIPENAGTGVFDGWTEDQTINLSNTEEELAEQIANGLFDGCEATVNYSEN